MELLGIIVPIRDYLSQDEKEIKVLSSDSGQPSLKLQKDRKYIIPEFQREIRWERENLLQLIEDVNSAPRYLGNIILTEYNHGKEFHIIDGQQRITTIAMLLTCIDHLHRGKIETFSPCSLEIQSFTGFSTMLTHCFTEESVKNEEIRKSDRLCQINSYINLWNVICENDTITARRDAKLFLQNLLNSKVNLIINRSENDGESIRYFVDVNLKGKKLDVEDIFKAYLFSNDSGTEVKEAWYQLKSNAVLMATKGIHYPLMKLIEHYLYCDLLSSEDFEGLTFGEDFLLDNDFSPKGNRENRFRKGTHVVAVIDDNSYMTSMLQRINKVAKFFCCVAMNEAPNDEIKQFFGCKEKIDSIEYVVLHNLIKKILKENKVLPKALLMKYTLSCLETTRNDQGTMTKQMIRKLYGVYLLFVLFIIFENKKTKDIFMKILKSDFALWYKELIDQIDKYFASDKISDTKLLVQYNPIRNETEEDYRFRCKSLATVYNYFSIKDRMVIVRDLEGLKAFVSDGTMYSTEHLIISESESILCGTEEIPYILSPEITKHYRNNLFNFIFIGNALNKKLSNYWLPRKMELVKNEMATINCAYSKMVIYELEPLCHEFLQQSKTADTIQVALNSFFSEQFKPLYKDYAKKILDKVMERLKERLQIETFSRDAI